MSLLENYFRQQSIYEEKYGKNTAVFLMKGSFYEVYGLENTGQAANIANMLNLVLTKANKKINEVSMSNPYMMGFPCVAFKKYLKVLMEYKYTIVTINQNINDPTERAIDRIYSPSTYIEDNTSDSNYACSVYIEFDETYYIGISFVELSTGRSYIYEILQGNSTHRLEELYRIVESYSPSELLCTFDNCSEANKKAIQQITQGTSNRLTHYDIIDKQYKNATYQNSILEKVYNVESQLSAIEYLDLELIQYSRISFCLLLQFCYAHSPDILSQIDKPAITYDENQLILHNNTLYQLNIITFNKGETSLLDVIDKTSTQLGKRLLKQQILHPMCKPNEIEKILDKVDKMKQNVQFYEEHLKYIGDIEKLHRRMLLGTLQPYELMNLITSYEHILDMLKYEDNEDFHQMEEYISTIKRTIDVEKINVSNQDIITSIFNEGYYDELRVLDTSMKKTEKALEKIAKELSKVLSKEGSVRVEKFALVTTVTRGNLLKQNTTGYFFKNDKSKSVVSNPNIESLFHKLIQERESMKPRCIACFIEFTKELASKQSEFFKDIHEYVANIDTIKSRAKCSIIYGHTKPIIKEDSQTGYIKASQLKHAIVEQLNIDTNYIPNDVNLMNDSQGILLYGCNGAGKSCYAKSIGLSIVMAQSGHHVPCELFEIAPFTRMYTRISDADNIYKGQSSFFVEMNELKSIIHYADSKSIVLGDEVCRGTEDVSAMAIVASTINWLLDKKSKFIFATHLLKLPELSCLHKHPNLKIKHLAVECDIQNEIVSFSRELKDGIGDYLYGLEIAQFILQNKDFINKATKTRNEILKKPSKLVINKKSRYNQSLFVDCCQFPGCNCQEDLDTHHITYQASSSGQSMNLHGTGNLVILCKEHHNAVHSGQIVINGWKSTSKGKILNYIKK